MLTPIFCFTQQKENLHKIIASDYSIDVRQQKLDSFFSKNAETMSPKNLGDCYHDYSVRWYYSIRWRQEGNDTFLEQGIEYAKKAAHIRKNQDSINYKGLKNSLFNIGYFNYKRKHHFEAIDAYNELIAIGHTDKKTMDAHRLSGNSYTAIGDFYKALLSFEKVILFCKKNKKHPKLLVRSLIDRATTYSAMGYQEFSIEIQSDLFKADSVIESARLQSKFNKSRIRQIEGNRLLITDDYLNAIPFFKKALESLDKKDSTSLAKIYNSLALSYHKSSNFKEALENSKKAISYNPYISSPYENLGDYYIQNNEFEEGLLQYQKAIAHAVNKTKVIAYTDMISSEMLELAANKDLLLGHLISKANGWVSYYKFDQNKHHLIQALQTFKLADQLVDLIRFESTEYKSKLFWREQGAALYMKAVEVSYLLNEPTAAYYFMEKNKALLLLEDITNEQAKKNTQLPNHIAKREFTLKRNIHLSENTLQHHTNESNDTVAILKDIVYKRKRTYEQFMDSLTIAFPDYAATKEKITILSYTDFKKKYTTNQENVIQYILNDDQGYGLFSSTTKSILFPIHDVIQLNADIFTLYKQLSHPFSNQKQLTMYQNVSYRVFQKLIPDNVYDLIKRKNLTIIPDYVLQQLSFETLVPTNKTLTYLIEDTEIRYAYSMSYLDRNQQVLRNPKNGFLGMAPVNFDKAGLSELRHSKNEITAIEKIYPGKVVLDNNATKNLFFNYSNDYRVIHLSTHADVGNTANPWIAFADSTISLHEIYATKNQSDMVVLSACKTSLGELKKGEGVMSLARGFFHSGTKSVLSSLWSANDKSNQELMINFYKNLNLGLTKSAALRKTKLNYINSHTGSEQSPFYWGSLVLIGDNEVLQLSSGFPIWGWTGLLVVLILAAVLFYRKRK
ncbi:CHAT domain-containing tetratricopeptide repeat protein [Aquimarina sp. MAR_2010_214]|uniref:CHAT domain-containing protein n=1 Tax=Aquimarina sp. MAR_2010_214 TaxID=1250026 RepID=UPI0013040267|nr:CHAT domain-containing tetratricopeptide repeat protein [Aquimarina sp. MAR_2010_214]